MKINNILICRNDAIGDTILALPMCGILKRLLPHVGITFLGTQYTQPVVNMSQYVDGFIDYNSIKNLPNIALQKLFKDKGIDAAILMKSDKELAKVMKRAKIKYRIGMLTWLKHWSTCNRFVNFSRSKSNLNEAQLNLKMLTPFGIHTMLSIQEIVNYYGFSKIPVLGKEWKVLLDPQKVNIILHPKTTGHGREWPLEYFTELVERMDSNKFKFFVSGVAKDAESMKDSPLLKNSKVVDLSGKMPLEQFIAFIHASDGMVAGSTGPIHLAAALEIHALGLYTNLKSRNANRWFPVGKLGQALECKEDDMSTITVESVLYTINKWEKIQRS